MIFVGLLVGLLLGAVIAWWWTRRAVVTVSPASEVVRVTAGNDRVVQAVESVAIGIVIYDESGAEVFQNPSALRFGGSRHQRPLVEAALADTAAWAQADGRAERNLELFGPPRQVLLFKGETVTADGAPAGMVVTIEDVTEQRRAMEMRRDFVANVSHELKTPVGALGLLAEAVTDADDPEVISRLAARLHSEALRLGSTIDDLLALSEIESGNLANREPVDPAALVTAALQRCGAAAELRDVTIYVGTSEDAAPLDDPDADIGALLDTAGYQILGDRRQLAAAVGNLVDNAVKYSGPHSGVRLQIRLLEDRPEPAMVIEVSDKGVGIPAADRERIFERFYRVDPARSRDTGGTGLGLSIVRHVAANHGGEVELESVEGVGSTFRLVVPAIPHDASVPAAPVRVSEQTRTPNTQ